MSKLPILYSFRRCPYAIRTRYTLLTLGVPVILREVTLKNKPVELLSLGGRSTVPQLIDCEGVRYQESMDIIRWALAQKNTAKPLGFSSAHSQDHIRAWLFQNDIRFKPWLDKYKYADRYPDKPSSYYRMQAEFFLRRLERRLAQSRYLLGDTLSIADVIVFPFIRQFRGVDSNWFDQSRYNHIKHWLGDFLADDVFQKVMQKYPAWEAGQEETVFQ